MLKLPSYQELSREQDAVNNLSLDSSHLIVGPPGTGKTILALYRAARLKAAGKHVLFLTFNRTLMQYIEQAAKEIEMEDCVTTFHSWFYSWYRTTFSKHPPQIEPFVFDWMKIYQHMVASNPQVKQYDHLIIDEAQDLPSQLYVVLRAIAENITVFADENQRITEYHSTIEQIQTCMGLSHYHKLTRNYRNSRNIAEFAGAFYAGLQSGIPDLPERKGPLPRAISTRNLEEQIAFIARYERNNSDKDVAVFVATSKQQYAIMKMLQRYQMKNKVQMYISKNYNYQGLNFHGRGIKILAYPSSKGLDFDAVFLPDLDCRQPSPGSDYEKMRFYVMTSRAREELFLMYSGVLLPPLLQQVSQHLFEKESLI